ncbi:MAG: protease modulator HflC [bacterium]|nr:protease modulator HflC [bacterium]
MKQIAIIVAVLIVLAVLVTAGGAVYVVDETQQVVITQFGRPVGEPKTEPGLKVKVPFVQKARYFDKRFLAWDGDPNQLPTKDKRFIFVDTYARWRIVDPLQFLENLQGSEREAQSKLDDALDGETRNTIARYNLIEVVRSSNREFSVSEDESETPTEAIESGRDALTVEVLENAKARVRQWGIEILDFRFKRLMYVTEVREEVYARMISERNRISERFRSEGAGEAARINGERERELKRIRSEAYREAQKIKGDADAEAAEIYAKAYNSDPEFYRFLKSMEVIGSTLDEETTLLLGTGGELMRYLDTSK